MESFLAYRVHNENGIVKPTLEEISRHELSAGSVVIKVAYSAVNYKDALACTGKGKILHHFPLVPGIDLAGIVKSSDDDRYEPGDRVLVVGCGMGEDFDGGYAQFARVNGDCIVLLPDGMTCRQAMQLGTAGFTAALAINQMEHNGQSPHHGPVIVTGASGGVGSLAIDLLSSRGYEVIAVTGKHSAYDWLRHIGATHVLDRNNLDLGRRPLEKGKWGGAIDNLGGEYLTWLTRSVKPRGNIASIGNASSPKLVTTVYPFILRGINLLGINSVITSRRLRSLIWHRLVTDFAPHHLDAIAKREIGLSELNNAFDALIKGQAPFGRTIVRISGGN